MPKNSVLTRCGSPNTTFPATESSSSTMSLLAYLAGVTERIRLGTAVTVLPFHNPIQLAEEVATVDLLSDGRMDFGVGRGFQWGEFHKLNIPMDEASRRFEETMEVLNKAWTSTEPFDHAGEFWLFNDMTVQPKPVQLPPSAYLCSRIQRGQRQPRRPQRLEPSYRPGGTIR